MQPAEATPTTNETIVVTIQWDKKGALVIGNAKAKRGSTTGWGDTVPEALVDVIAGLECLGYDKSEFKILIACKDELPLDLAYPTKVFEKKVQEVRAH